MITTLVVLLAVSVIFAAGCCALVRGGAIHERKMREIQERRARVASFLEAKSLQ